MYSLATSIGHKRLKYIMVQTIVVDHLRLSPTLDIHV
jgi:hypothetical protein